MIEIRLAEAAGGVERAELGARHLSRALPAAAAAAAGARAGRRRGAGAADRRARPRRRAVRSVPARSAVRIPGDDSRARHDPRGDAADRRHHVESHARDPRRDQAPLPLSLGRLSGCRARARDRPAQGARRATRALSREVVAFTQRLRTIDLFKSPGIAETLDWAEALVALDRITLDPETVANTLGALLKYQDDIGAITPEVAARLVARGAARASGSALPASNGMDATALFGARGTPGRQHPAFRAGAARCGLAGRPGESARCARRGRGGRHRQPRRFSRRARRRPGRSGTSTRCCSSRRSTSSGAIRGCSKR